MQPHPGCLQILAWTYISVCCSCALLIGLHEVQRTQQMRIMNLVWPITALYLGPVGVWLYRSLLPYTVRDNEGARGERREHAKPDVLQVFTAVCHCGAGCTLGDIVGESLAPSLGIVFAGKFGSKLVLDFVFAYAFGIAFQYFTIVPMRGMSFGKGMLAAIRADTISISLFELGMFGWMALSYFVLFPSSHLEPNEAMFWFMMQIAMMVGTLTSYPANLWLIEHGWKEKMPKYPGRPMSF